MLRDRELHDANVRYESNLLSGKNIFAKTNEKDKRVRIRTSQPKNGNSDNLRLWQKVMLHFKPLSDATAD